MTSLTRRLSTTDLTALDTPALRKRLAQTLTVTAEVLQDLAVIWRELERRGEDLSDLQSGLSAYLPMIASGHVAAEAVVQFAGRASVLRQIAQLPIEEQRRLADGGMVRVLVTQPNGTVSEEDLPAQRLSLSQIRQVFAGGRIRRPAEQLRALGASISHQERPRVAIESSTGMVRVGRSLAPAAEVAAALAAGTVAPPLEGERSPVMVAVSAEEHAAIKRMAADRGVTMQDLMRGALAMAGLLRQS